MTEIVIPIADEVDVGVENTEIVVNPVVTEVVLENGSLIQVTPTEVVLQAEGGLQVLVSTEPVELLEVGIPGAQGPPGVGGGGSGSDTNFYFTQNSPSTLWTIIHNLGKYPSVTVIDTTHRQMFGTVTYPTLSQVNVHFSIPQMGTATLN